MYFLNLSSGIVFLNCIYSCAFNSTKKEDFLGLIIQKLRTNRKKERDKNGEEESSECKLACFSIVSKMRFSSRGSVFFMT